MCLPWCVYNGIGTYLFLLFFLVLVVWCGLLRDFPLRLCGSGVLVVSDGRVVTLVYWLWLSGCLIDRPLVG